MYLNHLNNTHINQSGLSQLIFAQFVHLHFILDKRYTLIIGNPLHYLDLAATATPIYGNSQLAHRICTSPNTVLTSTNQPASRSQHDFQRAHLTVSFPGSLSANVRLAEIGLLATVNGNSLTVKVGVGVKFNASH